ncbi:hypothetical protein M513_03083 [Trichuris suis]|uniref:Uncharacterized protein n=1 Tax=Trichuris suis TaxID=68888 RepID=A0A085MFG3_9BILA|nr:hypothetical protein M513_03083 [Trichuris suis]
MFTKQPLPIKCGFIPAEHLLEGIPTLKTGCLGIYDNGIPRRVQLPRCQIIRRNVKCVPGDACIVRNKNNAVASCCSITSFATSHWKYSITCGFPIQVEEIDA